MTPFRDASGRARLFLLVLLAIPGFAARAGANPQALAPPPTSPSDTGEDLLACPASDLLDMYWLGADVYVRRSGLTLDQNRVYSVTTASDIPAARKPLVPVVDDLVGEAVVAPYGSGPDLVYYEMVSVCGVPEEESDPD